MNKRNLLFISHVIPGEGVSGQKQRVFYMLRGASKYFRIILLTISSHRRDNTLQEKIGDLADRIILLPSVYDKNIFTRLWYTLKAWIFIGRTSLKKSNYVIGEVEMTPDRIAQAVQGENIDLVIYEYWHAWKSASIFYQNKIGCILDMHDVLWKAFEQQVGRKTLPLIYKERIVRLYKENEQSAWKSFNRIISLNKIEQNMVKDIISPDVIVDFLPMGVDLNEWEYLWKYHERTPFRIGFYGGLSSKVNVDMALYCLNNIMPIIWKKKPETEFWLIGNRPADILFRKAKADSRIKITGYVEKVQTAIAEMDVILCPWKGVFGFRSRIIEVLAVGTPMVVSEDAIAGMGIVENAIMTGQSDSELADRAMELLENKNLAQQISLTGRKDVEQKYSYESTYLNYFNNLAMSIPGKPNG